MCGIWACLGKIYAGTKDRIERLKGRGPEGSRHVHLDKVASVAGPGVGRATLGFTRLALNGVGEAGTQPFSQEGVTWICNGEIYNWRDLAARHGLDCRSESDCSVLGPLWTRFRHDPTTFFRALDGVFAMVLVDGDTAYVGRDPYGVRPLFYAVGPGCTYVASEMKALLGFGKVWPFQPGTWTRINLQTGVMEDAGRYHVTPWLKNPTYRTFEGLDAAKAALQHSLVAAVQKRLMTERPIAALLSGGLDSSLIAALVQRELKALGKPPSKPSPSALRAPPTWPTPVSWPTGSARTIRKSSRLPPPF